MSGSTVNEYITFKSYFSLGSSASYIMSHVSALHSYPQLPVMDSYAEADDETTVKVTALISAHNQLCKVALQDIFLRGSGEASEEDSPVPVTFEPEPKITDASIVDLIVEHPESVDEITDLIITKKIRDGALLREIIESNTKSIRDGLL